MSGRKQFDVGAAVDQAMRVFWERGYADTSLDALSAATGLGRGSLYGAFGNKEALFTRCLDRYSALYGTRFEQALAAHPHDPVRSIEAFFAVTLDRIADPSVPAGCLVAQSAAQSSTLSAECGARVRSLISAQQQRVRTSLAGSSADGRSLDELATFVVAVNQSLAVLSRVGSPDSELRSVARVACSTVANAISAG
ncbi:TetR/AcrR family transcriptional regulator [Streptomyces aquilus]|uniref:TetR/AcrR family transcriptional regulator n=1 Tax=Streptomyces aquilus TaxID=2548456 RepID=A0A3Q9C5S9_9ACTN|nr:TetR/AcrR family transcriptional regulator [Streptomyces aquilus]AZP22541.1 TetR/AcrR family transcriptional regulator [Streptomyces aquilus]